VPRINIYPLRLQYLLMAVFLGIDAWTHILTFQGEWDPVGAAAWSVWASYSLLAIPGIFYPLRMLPLILLEILYKLIWLVVVAYPLWSDGRLAESPAQEMTYAFLWVVLPIVATPWKYAFNTYVMGRRGDGAYPTCQTCREPRTGERVAVDAS
jgi:hypothetical protein